jgi:hypothetical protein
MKSYLPEAQIFFPTIIYNTHSDSLLYKEYSIIQENVEEFYETIKKNDKLIVSKKYFTILKNDTIIIRKIPTLQQSLNYLKEII